MLKLCNLTTYEADLQVFEHNRHVLSSFLASHSIDGIELLIDQPVDEAVLPLQYIKGVHLRYWSNWMDFWLGDKQQLETQFGSQDSLIKYYGGYCRSALVDNYRAEVNKAIAAGAEYAVLHISNARLNEIFTYDFYYKDTQVIDAAIELVNAVLDDLDTNITILFENLWWPGLTLTDKQLASRLLEGIHYPNTGFMLDTGHLMNTNRSLRNQQQGIKYILDTVKNLGELKQAIKGIHLHHSLSGEYVLQTIKDADRAFDKDQIMSHILKIDQHLPFEHPDIHKVIDYIQPNYLVHEFMFGSRAELSACLKKQNAALVIV